MSSFSKVPEASATIWLEKVPPDPSILTQPPSLSTVFLSATLSKPLIVADGHIDLWPVVVRLRYRLRVSKAVSSPLLPHQQPCSDIPSRPHTPLHLCSPLILAQFLCPPSSVNRLVDGSRRPGKLSENGNLPSIFFALCEPGFHGSPPLFLLLPSTKRGDDRSANPPSFASPPFLQQSYRRIGLSYLSSSFISSLLLSAIKQLVISLVATLFRPAPSVVYYSLLSLLSSPVRSHLTCPLAHFFLGPRPLASGGWTLL